MRKIVEIPVNKIKIIDIDFKEKSDDEIEWLKRYIQKRGYVLPMSVTKYKDKYILNNSFEIGCYLTAFNTGIEPLT